MAEDVFNTRAMFLRRDVRLDIEVNRDQRREVEELFADVPKMAQQVIADAVNKTANKGKTNFARRVRNETGLAVKETRGRIDIRKAKPISGDASPFARIRIRSTKIPLIRFKARQTKEGVSFDTGRAGGKQVLKSGFIKSIKYGKQVLRRASSEYSEFSGEFHLVPRYPVYVRYGPSLLDFFENAPGVFADEVNKLGDVLQEQVNSQMDRRLKRRKVDR